MSSDASAIHLDFLFLKNFHSKTYINILNTHEELDKKKPAILNSNFQSAFLYIIPFVTQTYRASHEYRLEKLYFTEKEIENSEKWFSKINEVLLEMCCFDFGLKTLHQIPH